MEAALQAPVFQTLIILLISVLSDAIWRWPIAYHPLTLMRYLAETMAAKVRPSHTEYLTQHYISGSLGPALLIIPLAILLANLLALAEYPWFFEGLILLTILDFGHDRIYFKQVIKALAGEKKMLARDRASQFMARDTERLSDIGVAKASIEALLLRFLIIYCGVLFWFIAVGPITALCYRLIITISWQWHPRRPGFNAFAKPSRFVSKLMALPGVILGTIVMGLVTNPITAAAGFLRSPVTDITSRVLASFGAAMGFRLGGPAIYHRVKYRHTRVGGNREVRFSDMTYSYRAILRAMVLITCLGSLLLLTIWQTG